MVVHFLGREEYQARLQEGVGLWESYQVAHGGVEYFFADERCSSCAHTTEDRQISEYKRNVFYKALHHSRGNELYESGLAGEALSETAVSQHRT